MTALALEDRVAGLGYSQRAWLEAQLGLAGTSWPRADAARASVLSLQEERLLALSSQSRIPLWQNAVVVRLRGGDVLKRAAAAVNRALMRHQSLRTGYVRGSGVITPVVHTSVPLHLPLVDLRHVAGGDRDGHALRVMVEEANRPFDCSSPPLLRSLLVQTHEDEMLLLITAHELAADEASLLRIADEIASDCDGRAEPAESMHRYRDYAAWQRENPGHAAASVAGINGRPAAGRAETIAVPLDGDTAGRLLALAAHERVPAWCPFLALCFAFLHEVNEDELAIDVPLLDTIVPRDVVGPFATVIPLRVAAGASVTLRGLLQRVRDTAAADAERRPGGPAGMAFSFHEFEHPAVEPLPHGLRGIARAPLGVVVTHARRSVSMLLEYDTNAYDAAQASRFASQLARLARAASLDPDRSFGTLDLLTGEEHRRIDAWTTAVMPLPEERTLHEMLARRAVSRGDAVAAIAGGAQMTYAEWEARANQLARVLRARGVEAEMRVALLLPRSLDYLVAVMAVLKAGAAFVPLDIDHPGPRLAFVLKDAGVRCAITMAAYAPILGDIPAVIVDREDGAIAAGSTAPLDADIAPEALAYIIYTSGSTGGPKGVMVPHRGLPNLAEAARRIHELTPDSRVALFGAFSFDAAVADMAMALAAGATLCIPAAEELGGEYLLAALRRDRATIVTIPPSVLATVPHDSLPDLATLIVAGEPCPAELAQQWSRGRRLHNCYGPTEATVWATWERYDGDGAPGIGRPVPNTRVHLLDRMMRPVAPGMTGELYLGGINVARAYIGRPGLTAERFVPDPFSESPGMRLYRTGDLARHRADGRLEFLGRADDQLKIRGWRVEPGEVAAVLRRHPLILEAAVVAATSRNGSVQLAACCTVRGALTPDEVRAFARERLPGPLVPAAIAIVDAIPLSANGKVDREAVRRATQQVVAPAERFAAPAESAEAVLAAMWSELLERVPASANDNFFDLGGHSLLATRLLSRVRQTFSVEIALRSFFENPTIAGMAQAIRAREARS